ncbi:hypothetical protein CYY_006812 [Polysphondylium violaceum]|uniref:Palmitoyltransferase n=1 Tax=Polysphondylium violaceum TaxID=133409 RepID=A0A8J4PRX2_9MYCE|nr:hypothetical protein CYY_006812 [Polysphondylium violaceum]
MDLILSLIVGYVIFAVFILYTLILGQSDYHRDGVIGWCHYFLTAGLQIHCLKCFSKICPRKVRSSFGSCYHYFMYKPNRILQGLYLSLVLVGFYLFHKDAFPFLQAPYLEEFHKVGAIFMVSFTLITFIIASVSDPGIITTDNVDQYNVYDYDRYLYIKKHCETCNFTKPARSKHCRICDKCISRFDHHCPWINNCVGEKNLKYFLLFVLSTAILCLYGAFLCGSIMYSFVKVKDLFNLGFHDNGRWVPITTSMVVQFIAFETRSVLPLGILCIVISVFLFYFFAYHLYLVVKNTTTNETFKWSDIKDQIKLQKLNNSNNDNSKSTQEDSSSNNNSNSKSKQQKRNQNSKKKDALFPSAAIDKYTLTLPLPDSFKDLKNIYNRGVINNIIEVILPLSQNK